MSLAARPASLLTLLTASIWHQASALNLVETRPALAVALLPVVTPATEKVGLYYGRCMAALALVAITVACSPALNWREVPLQGLVALLPCKPDHAERKQQLGPSDVTLRMSGCEASGALYAISHVQLGDLAQLEPTKEAWRQGTLAAMQATPTPTPQTPQPSIAPTGQTKAVMHPEKLVGKRPDGSAVQAQLLWLNKGRDLYHVAVYGPKLRPEMTELLFSELSLR